MKDGNRCSRAVVSGANLCWTHAQNNVEPDSVFMSELEREKLVADAEAAERAKNKPPKKPGKPKARSAMEKRGWKGAGRKPLTKEQILKIARLGDGSLSMTEVAAECKVNTGSVHYAVSKLRKEGIVMKFRQTAFGRNPAWDEALKELKDEQSAAAAGPVSNVDGDGPVSG